MAVIERALVLDKNDANQLVFDVVLPTIGIKDIVKARVPAEALKLIEEKEIHLLVTAWELDGMTGAAFVQRLHAVPKRRRIPVVICSKDLSGESAKLLKDLGIETFFAMPLSKDKVTPAVRALVEYERQLSPQETHLRAIEDLVADNRVDDAMAMAGPELSVKGPLYVRAQTLLGELFLLKGDRERAEQCLRAALGDKPDHVPAVYMLSRCLSAQGKHAEAIETLKALAGVSPLNVLTLTNLGAAYTNASRMQEAKQVLESACEIDPDSQSVKDERGKIALKEGDRETAMQLLGTTQNPGEIARYLNSMGVAASLAGQFDEAVATYRDALRLLSDKTHTHVIEYNMGLAFKKKGDLASALRVMGRSYLACPSFEKSLAGFVRVSQEMREKGMAVDEALVSEVAKTRKASKPAPDSTRGN